MPAQKFKSLDQSLAFYQIAFEQQNFVAPSPSIKMPQRLKEETFYYRKNFPYKISEAAICEMILFPILREALRNYEDLLMIWSHRTLVVNNKLSFIPDYMIAKQSKMGKIFFENPLLAVVEAKKDDFDLGWGQCSQEMYALQQLNTNNKIPVFGIVSNGDDWEFGKLNNKTFILNDNAYTILHPDELFAAINYFFEQCKINALKIK